MSPAGAGTRGRSHPHPNSWVPAAAPPGHPPPVANGTFPKVTLLGGVGGRLTGRSQTPGHLRCCLQAPVIPDFPVVSQSPGRQHPRLIFQGEGRCL